MPGSSSGTSTPQLRTDEPLVADIYNGEWIAEQGRRQGWPAETLAKNDAITHAQRESFAKAVQADLRIAYGTDSGVYPHGWNARQLPYMVRHGMTPMAALRSATVVAAELLGWQDRVGALAPGRYADVIAVPGDPLADLELLSDVPFVMKGGQVLKESNLRAQLRRPGHTCRGDVRDHHLL
jgi:imidazolonepropionase-like amidohydrolase